MADAKKCDRCGKLFEVEKSYNGVPVFTKLVFFYESVISSSTYDKTKIDLCPDCEKSFDDWLHPIKGNTCEGCKHRYKDIDDQPCNHCSAIGYYTLSHTNMYESDSEQNKCDKSDICKHKNCYACVDYDEFEPTTGRYDWKGD